MTIYVVQYSTGHDYNEIVDYYSSEEDANQRAKQLNKDNPGMDYYVSDIEVN